MEDSGERLRIKEWITSGKRSHWGGKPCLPAAPLLCLGQHSQQGLHLCLEPSTHQLMLALPSPWAPLLCLPFVSPDGAGDSIPVLLIPGLPHQPVWPRSSSISYTTIPWMKFPLLIMQGKCSSPSWLHKLCTLYAKNFFFDLIKI